MSTLKLASSPVAVTFLLGEQPSTIFISELTLKQGEEYHQAASAACRKAYYMRLAQISAPLLAIERQKMLLEAAKNEPDLSDDIDRWMSSPDGIKLLLQTASAGKLSDEVWEVIQTNKDNTSQILIAWKAALGIKDEPVVKATAVSAIATQSIETGKVQEISKPADPLAAMP